MIKIILFNLLGNKLEILLKSVVNWLKNLIKYNIL